MPENTKEQITSPNDTSQSHSNGKKKMVTNIATSATNLLHSVLPMDGKSAASNLSTLLNNINTNQKPGTSSTSTTFLQQEWITEQIYEDKSHGKFINHNTNKSVNAGFNDAEWENWINSSEYLEHDNFSKVSNHKYPFHHHFHNQDFHHSYQQVDGIEIIDFLNSSNYTEEVYDSKFKDDECIAFNSFNKYGSQLNDFLEASDILTYLTQTRYTDDVYGMPIFLKRLVSEAKEEIFSEQDASYSNKEVNESHRKTGIERLKMVRDHLIKRKERSTDNEMREWLDNWTEKDMELIWSN
ncbi:6952_t:CDS:1 [Scutellospora calospora]|uniref:6952_t:CDS:1 n=1 Tax=Scutellospora calospora TaxID=85575 RepID=A0ACA9JYP7_9GLOM|nr:6952_t:CDS:1 [Scutellospora calospora]